MKFKMIRVTKVGQSCRLDPEGQVAVILYRERLRNNYVKMLLRCEEGDMTPHFSPDDMTIIDQAEEEVSMEPMTVAGDVEAWRRVQAGVDRIVAPIKAMIGAGDVVTARNTMSVMMAGVEPSSPIALELTRLHRSMIGLGRSFAPGEAAAVLKELKEKLPRAKWVKYENDPMHGPCFGLVMNGQDTLIVEKQHKGSWALSLPGGETFSDFDEARSLIQSIASLGSLGIENYKG